MAANSRLAVAAHIVSVLATKEGQSLSSGYVAKSVNTHPVVIRRILSALAKAGIVKSEKGTSGGSTLVRCPNEISLWDLYRALGEEHLFAIHRNPENPRCEVSCRMKRVLGKVFAGAEKAAQARLKKVTVKQLLCG